MSSACFSFDGVLQTALSCAANGESAVDLDRPLHFRGVCQHVLMAVNLPRPIGDFRLVA